ncbi:MAG: DUF3667 domain-containing protein [Pseudomonadota bacterium]
MLDGLFDWDGRLLRTLRGLFLRPGQVARDYVDGRRASYTPPMRLYVVISVIFFATMGLASMRVIALNTSLDEDGDVTTVMTMWQSGEPQRVPRISDAQREESLARLPAQAPIAPFRTLVRAALEDPLMLEQAANASASQAQILMVVIFTLLCLVLHPRRRLIEHIVHALYFHACALPVAGLMLVISARVSMSTGWLIAWAMALGK